MGCVVRVDDVVEVEQAVARGEDEQPVGPQRISRPAARTVIGADIQVYRSCAPAQFAAAARDDDECGWEAVEVVVRCHVWCPACPCVTSAVSAPCAPGTGLMTWTTVRSRVLGARGRGLPRDDRKCRNRSSPRGGGR